MKYSLPISLAGSALILASGTALFRGDPGTTQQAVLVLLLFLGIVVAYLPHGFED